MRTRSQRAATCRAARAVPAPPAAPSSPGARVRRPPGPRPACPARSLLRLRKPVRPSSHRTPAAKRSRVLGSQSRSSQFLVSLSTRFSLGVFHGDGWRRGEGGGGPRAGETPARPGSVCRAFGGSPTSHWPLLIPTRKIRVGHQQGLWREGV